MKRYQLLFKYALPKEIQDLIGEYNVDHREKFNKVLKNIKGIYGLECQGCNITRYSTCLTSYVVEEFVCSIKCKKVYYFITSSYAKMV